MTLLYKALGEVENNTHNSVNSLNKKGPQSPFLYVLFKF